jgi:hypothetical protein
VRAGSKYILRSEIVFKLARQQPEEEERSVDPSSDVDHTAENGGASASFVAER